MDVNILHHHVLQGGPEAVVGELLVVQRVYYFCSSRAFLLLVIFLQLHLAIFTFVQVPLDLVGLSWR